MLRLQTIRTSFRERLTRPFDPEIPYPRAMLWFLLPAMLLALAGLALAATSGPVHWPAAILLGTLIMASQLLVVRVSSELELSVSGVYVILALVALDLPTAAVASIMLVVSTVILCRLSWVQAFSCGYTTGTSVLISLFAVDAIRSLPLGAAPELLLAGLAVALILQVVEFIAHGINMYAASRMPESPPDLMRQAVGEMRESLGMLVLQLALQLPVALLGAIAFSVMDWSPILLVFPMVVAWYSALQSARIEALRDAVGIDALTGLFTRNRFSEDALAEGRNAVRYGHQVGLMICDLDNFKRVNDTLGHLAGDAALRSTGSIIRRSARDHGAIGCRFGGEEFVVLLPACTQEAALALAEELRVQTESALKPYDSSLSIGVAMWDGEEELDAVLDAADHALYAAKGAGKNQVVFEHDRPAGASSADAA